MINFEKFMKNHEKESQIVTNSHKESQSITKSQAKEPLSDLALDKF